MSAPAIQFKGSGWYVTDYAAKKANQSLSAEKTEAGDSTKETAKERTKEPSKEPAAKAS